MQWVGQKRRRSRRENGTSGEEPGRRPEPNTWHSPGTDQPSREAGTAGETSPSDSVEAEYRERKLEDLQNYINAKHELFLMAFPNAQARDRAEFYRETTEGFLNKYVRDQMFCYEPVDVESFGARAVNVVQIERRQIQIGDSNTQTMEGLIPVTRPIREGQRKRRRGTRGGKSLHHRQEG